jgi:hypothetical protein
MAKRSKRTHEQRTSEIKKTPVRASLNLEALEASPYFLPALMACGLIMGILFYDPNLGLSGDDAQFINIGRSLAAGHGFSEMLEEEPVAHTKYPFGFPLLIAFVDLVFPGSLDALKGLVILLYAVSLPLIYKVIRQVAEPAFAGMVFLLCLVSPPLLDFSHQVMSEIPFVPPALLALFFLHRAHEKPTYGNLAGTVIAMMAAYYIRSAGIAIVGTGVLFFVLHKQWKEAAIVGGGCFALALPWSLRNSALGGGDYVNQLLSIDPYRPDQGLLTFGTLVERVVINLEIYGLREIPRIFLPSLISEANWILGLVFSGVVLYAIITGIQQRQVLPIYVLCYLGLHLFWPQVWSDIRFLIPAIPVLFYMFFNSGFNLIKKVTASSRTVVAVCFLMCAASNIYAAYQLSEQLGHFPPNWKNYFEAGDWIRDHTHPDAKVACRKPFLTNATSNRKTTGYIWESPEAIVKDFENKNVDIVIVDQIGFASTPQYLIPAIQKYPDRFEVLHIVHNPDTYILKFKRHESGAGDAP